MELSDSTFNKILIFSPKQISYIFSKKLFLYFRKWKPWKNLYFLKRKLFLYFIKQKPLQKKFLIFQETETLKNFLCIRREVLSSKNKKKLKKKKTGQMSYISRNRPKLSSPNLKKLNIFQKELPKHENQKFLKFLFTFFLQRENFSSINTKEKRFLYLPYTEAIFLIKIILSCNCNKAFFFLILCFFFLYSTSFCFSFCSRFLYGSWQYCCIFSYYSLERFWYLPGFFFLFFFFCRFYLFSW